MTDKLGQEPAFPQDPNEEMTPKELTIQVATIFGCIIRENPETVKAVESLLTNALKEAIAAERERCARIVDEFDCSDEMFQCGDEQCSLARDIAKSIRQAGKEGK